MYKLLIVEDELSHYRNILEEDEWNKLGFTLIGTADHGLEALEMVEEVMPDIVITDINMPLMDGLELTRRLHSKFDRIRIVILTGYDQFDYAQTAANLKVEAFLLKPVRVAELEELLVRIRHSLDDERESIRNLEQLKAHFASSLPILRIRALENILCGKISKKDYEKAVTTFSLNLSGQHFLVCALSPDTEDGCQQFGSTPDESHAMLHFILHNIAQEIAIEKHKCGEVIEHEGNLLILMSFPSLEPTAIRDKANEVCSELLLCVRKFLNICATVGIGIIVNDVSSIGHSRDDALLALNYRLILGGNRLIFLDDLENRKHNLLYFTDLDHQELMQCIKLSERNKMQVLIAAFFDRISNNNVYWYDCQVYIVNMVNVLFCVAHDFDIECNAIFDPSWKQMMVVREYNSLQELRKTFTTCCFQLMDHIGQLRIKSCNSFAEKTVALIRQKYGDPEFSIEKVAPTLHICAGYLSNILKKQLNTTFRALLLNMRMDKAKELLRNSSLMINEISKQVGFEDQYYFSFCFKKHTGLSPRQYRNDNSQ